MLKIQKSVTVVKNAFDEFISRLSTELQIEKRVKKRTELLKIIGWFLKMSHTFNWDMREVRENREEEI